jgi:hypothetical protein
MWRLNHPDDVAPPVTGDPYALARPGWSRRRTLSAWTGYLFAYCGSRFLAYTAVGLLVYPIALAIQWLRLVIFT